MPRLPHSLIHAAAVQDPLLVPLLRVCRDLASARSELRWLREHISNSKFHGQRHDVARASTVRLHQLVRLRSRGAPLQYILGSQPFGELDILCGKGVLIPRPETESTTTHLAHLLLSRRQYAHSLRILDLCTGTGCISLLLHSLLAPQIPSLQILGVDASATALAYARRNLHHNTQYCKVLDPVRAAKEVQFIQTDIFDTHLTDLLCTKANDKWDVIISNPPYISPRSFYQTTSSSVRKHEPKIALVPSRDCSSDERQGDAFYPRLLELARQFKAKVLLMEVADVAQAKRVAKLVLQSDGAVWSGCEIWRDWPGAGPGKSTTALEKGREAVRVQVQVLGEGNGRAVLAWTKEGGELNWDIEQQYRRMI